MRPSIIALALLLPFTPALAGSKTGGGGGGKTGGGPLSTVSSGIGKASGGGGGGGGGGSGGGGNRPPVDPQRGDEGYRDHEHRYLHHHYLTAGVVAAGGIGFYNPERLGVVAPSQDRRASVHLYLGAHMVKDSDGALFGDLSFVDRRFRVAGGVGRYYERQPDDSLLRVTTGNITGGLRIDDMGRTKVFVEAGVAYVKTSGDPVMDSSITGALGGIHVEHALARGTSLVGDAHLLFFPDDIRATSARAAIRFGHFQAGIRVLDFNVGEALYGPELGLSF